VVRAQLRPTSGQRKKKIVDKIIHIFAVKKVLLKNWGNNDCFSITEDHRQLLKEPIGLNEKYVTLIPIVIQYFENPKSDEMINPFTGWMTGLKSESECFSVARMKLEVRNS